MKHENLRTSYRISSNKRRNSNKPHPLILLVPNPQNGQTQSICRQKLTNCLSEFDHFAWFALKGLISVAPWILSLE